MSVAMVVAMAFSVACSDDLLNVTEGELQEGLQGNGEKMTLFLKLGGSDSVRTRLTYHEVDFEGKRAMLTRWSADDKIAVTLRPGSEYVEGKQTELSIVSGVGTTSAEFQGDKINYVASQWFFYFPADRVAWEKEFLYSSYLGQVQHGNGNTEHLKDFHTSRYIYTSDTYVGLDGFEIDLSGSEAEESACMKFNLTNLPQIVPVKITLECLDKSGNPQSCFWEYNYVDYYYGSYSPMYSNTSILSMELADFEATDNILAYMMMSNADVEMQSNSTLRVKVATEDGVVYYCDKVVEPSVVLEGGLMHTISCADWKKSEKIDGFDTETGVIIFQEHTRGSGLDIIIMGDGYASDKFEEGGQYDVDMMRAYEDFFAVEPYKALKDYFNVYCIKAVSQDNHDAEPLTNGAVQGDAVTRFNTQFTANSTSISGNDDLAVQYAMQAIRTRGGEYGSPCVDENQVYDRAHKSLIIVVVNVPCHAGTCYSRVDNSTDYAPAFSVAYNALNTSDFMRKWTLIHEAGGHGFGKLADEYDAQRYYNPFDTGLWTQLDEYHRIGFYRNIDKYWKDAYKGKYSITYREDYPEDQMTQTTTEGVYWAPLVSGYSESEGLGVYEGAFTSMNFFCRPTENSIMNSQFSNDGQFFNAISRWAIWYRLMMMAEAGVVYDFQSSLQLFTEFDSKLTIDKNDWETSVYSNTAGVVPYEQLLPLAPPVLIEGHWENGRFIEK